MKAKSLIEDMLPVTNPEDQQPHGVPAGKPQKPEGWGALSTAEVLAVFPPEVQQRIIDILNECAPDTFEASRRLKPLFIQYEIGLTKIGLQPAFAAYAIPYAVYSHL